MKTMKKLIETIAFICMLCGAIAMLITVTINEVGLYLLSLTVFVLGFVLLSINFKR